MEISVEGLPDKLGIDCVKSAIAFYGHRLTKVGIYDRLKINVDFIPDFAKTFKSFGDCRPSHGVWFANQEIRSFDIRMDQSLAKRRCLMTLAHEMVHVKQYANKELQLANNGYVWLGKQLALAHDVNEQPYEIEANGREGYLYHSFRDSYRNR